MSVIEFDRDAVGVSAKEDWTDSQTFATIGSFISYWNVSDAAKDLPEGDNAGVKSLRTNLGSFKQIMRWTVLEYSDACATLGSGQEEAISDFDSSEYKSKQTFLDLMAQRLNGGE